MKIPFGISTLTIKSMNRENEKDSTWIRIGTLGRPHGVRGQIRCYPETYDLERHALLKKVLVKKGVSEWELEVESSELLARFWRLKFKGWDSPEAVSLLVSGELLIALSERLPEPEDAYYLSDFSGYEATLESGEVVGEIIECVELPSTDAFAVKFSKEFYARFSAKEILAPWIDSCVLSVEPSEKKIVFDEEFLKSLCAEEK